MAQHEISRLLPRHFRIVELALEGMHTNEIAAAMGMHPQSISLILNSTLVQEEMSRRRSAREIATDDAALDGTLAVRKHLEDSAMDAARTQSMLLESESDSIKLGASNSILDRVLGKSNGESGGTKVMILVQGDIDRLNLALVESGSGGLGK
jgi:hypothetical protein